MLVVVATVRFPHAAVVHRRQRSIGSFFITVISFSLESVFHMHHLRLSEKVSVVDGARNVVRADLSKSNGHVLDQRVCFQAELPCGRWKVWVCPEVAGDESMARIVVLAG